VLTEFNEIKARTILDLKADQNPTNFETCFDQSVPVAGAIESGADTIAARGISAYLASITFCAIIATGYSQHSVPCLLSGKTSEVAGVPADRFSVKDSVMSNKSLGLAAIFVILLIAPYGIAQDQMQGAPVNSGGSAVDSQGIRRYLLGPGDVIDVRVFGQPDLSSVAEVDSDGNLSSLPFLEKPIRAQCRTEKDIQKDVALAYAKYIKNPQVSVLIKERKSRQPATIFGAVRYPQQIVMMREVRLHELVTKAGGWTDRASGTIEVMHTEPLMCSEDGTVFQKASLSEKGSFGIAIYKINDLKAGKEDADPVIWPGDIVKITEGDPVYVTGMVARPTELVIREKLTLSHAIAMAGGPQRMAKTSEVHILRQKEGGQDDLKYNYDLIRKGKDADPELKPFDIVELGEASLFSNKGMGDLFKGIVRGTAGVAGRGIIY
jgi:polysaccharide export outer membrane protein